MTESAPFTQLQDLSTALATLVASTAPSVTAVQSHRSRLRAGSWPEPATRVLRIQPTPLSAQPVQLVRACSKSRRDFPSPAAHSLSLRAPSRMSPKTCPATRRYQGFPTGSGRRSCMV